jgi:hypothetical protein
LFDPGQPQTSREIQAALRSVAAEGERFLGTVPAAEFFAPQGAKWSPAEHARHLIKSVRPIAMALPLPKLLLRLRYGKAKGSRGFAAVREAYLAALAAGADAGRYAPSLQPLPEDPARRQAEILAGLRDQVETLVERIGTWSEPALDRYFMPHPVLGLLTVREMLFFTALHNAHHLNRVAERRGGVNAGPPPGVNERCRTPTRRPRIPGRRSETTGRSRRPS